MAVAVASSSKNGSSTPPHHAIGVPCYSPIVPWELGHRTNGNAALLAAHDEIWMVLRHGAPATGGPHAQHVLLDQSVMFQVQNHLIVDVRQITPDIQILNRGS